MEVGFFVQTPPTLESLVIGGIMRTDFEIIKSVNQGHIEDFAILVHRLRGPLVGYLSKYLNNKDLAEDVAQDAFLKAFDKLQTFQFRSTFKSWLYRIAINTAKNRMRKWRPQVDINDVVVPVDCQVVDDMIFQEDCTQLRDHINRLPLKQKQAMKLRTYNDMSFRQVARRMKCPYDTAKANYRHGLVSLRSKFKVS